MSTAFDLYFGALRAGLRRDSDLGVAEWADRYRMLSEVSSAEPGMWRTERTPYLRAIMDDLSPDSDVQRIVFIKGAQLGGTECGNNWLGYVVHYAPGPMLYVEPTLDDAKLISKQRVAPMIEATPELQERIKDHRTRDSENTVLIKKFPGGVLRMAGANSPRGLRGMPAKYLFMDEVDEYEGDIGGQGDPVALAEKRTTTFSRRKVFLCSTPTLKGLSRIEREYGMSDQRRYFVPCPHCGHMDWMRWQNIRWEEGDPFTAKLACTGCDTLIDETHKTDMLGLGEWRSTAEKPSTTHGYHLSSLYSPWKTWGECADELVKSKENPFLLKVWVNTVLGESWEVRGDSVDPSVLRARCETYKAEVPNGVGVLVCTVDVQGDRLEAQVDGYGAGEEKWLIAFTQIFGDPEQLTPASEGEQTVWFQLDEFRRQEFTHESGRKLRVELTVIDSGGSSTEQVYKYCASRLAERVYPIKGGSELGRPLVQRPSITNRYRIPLFVLCVDTGKDMVLGRLRIGTAGPGRMHFPSWVDDEYFDQLCAERKVPKYVKGRGNVYEWVQLRPRNEALDLTVYSVSALHICGRPFIQSLPDRARRWAQPLAGQVPGAVAIATEPISAGTQPAPAAGPESGAPAGEAGPAPKGRRRPRRGGWATGWR